MAPNAPRPFTTSARVHPAIPVFDPHTISRMQSSVPAASRARLGRMFLPVTTALFVGMATTHYLENRAAAASTATTQTPGLAQRQQNAALMSAYGDRSSLEDVQRAMELYEVQ